MIDFICKWLPEEKSFLFLYTIQPKFSEFICTLNTNQKKLAKNCILKEIYYYYYCIGLTYLKKFFLIVEKFGIPTSSAQLLENLPQFKNKLWQQQNEKRDNLL